MNEQHTQKLHTGIGTIDILLGGYRAHPIMGLNYPETRIFFPQS